VPRDEQLFEGAPLRLLARRCQFVASACAGNWLSPIQKFRIIVLSVEPQFTLRDTGFRRGDLILELNGREMESADSACRRAAAPVQSGVFKLDVTAESPRLVGG